jgi:uncharacterized protein YcbX
VGRVAGLARYPVKSMAGEDLTEARFGPLGITGDRRWAAYTADGGIGSGKTTRRFRRVDGLLSLRARLDSGAPADAVPVIGFPDGRQYRADDPSAARALTALLGRPLQLRPEGAVRHHDESRVHLITTAGLRFLEQVLGHPVDGTRFRPNVVLDVDGDGFVEDGWEGRTMALGDQVRLLLGPGMPRCVMVGLPQPQAGLPTEPRLLTELGRVHQVEFGLQAEVVQGGTVRSGDLAALGG